MYKHNLTSKLLVVKKDDQFCLCGRADWVVDYDETTGYVEVTFEEINSDDLRKFFKFILTLTPKFGEGLKITISVVPGIVVKLCSMNYEHFVHSMREIFAIAMLEFPVE